MIGKECANCGHTVDEHYHLNSEFIACTALGRESDVRPEGFPAPCKCETWQPRKHTIQVEDMFENACKAWGVEMRDKGKLTGTSTLYFEGKPLDITWCRELSEDLGRFHGRDMSATMVTGLLSEVIQAIRE